MAVVVTEAEVAGGTVAAETTTTTAEAGVGATSTVPGAVEGVAIVTTTATTAAEVRQHPALTRLI